MSSSSSTTKRKSFTSKKSKLKSETTADPITKESHHDLEQKEDGNVKLSAKSSSSTSRHALQTKSSHHDVAETLPDSSHIHSKSSSFSPTIFKNPIIILQYFLLYMAEMLQNLGVWLLGHRKTMMWILFMVVGFVIIYQQDGAHQESIQKIESTILWYLWWVALGVASSIGLGTGLHTFVLFLGPHIAHVTITAYQCQSLDFDVRGENSFLCSETQFQGKVTILTIFQKIILESFFWGMGTALGELPPYFVARAASMAGQENEELEGINKIIKKLAKERSISETVQFFMFNLMDSLGFWGILLAASIPNPLFDLAGIICGHFSIPFATFFGATFIGKAMVKSSIQSFFIILSFSKDFLELLLYECERVSPWIHDILKKFLDDQANKFGNKSGHSSTNDQHHSLHQTTSTVQTNKINYVSLIWNGFMLVMILYFVLSTIESLALVQKRREDEKEQIQGKLGMKHSDSTSFDLKRRRSKSHLNHHHKGEHEMLRDNSEKRRSSKLKKGKKYKEEQQQQHQQRQEEEEENVEDGDDESVHSILSDQKMRRRSLRRKSARKS